jgi:hypothetical protein
MTGKETQMVQLDAHLLLAAQRIIDGANAHDLHEMIGAYKQAVELHNMLGVMRNINVNMNLGFALISTTTV